MKPIFTSARLRLSLIAILFSLIATSGFAQTQIGKYQFTALLGVLGSCPNTDNNVTSQPANAVFSPFTNVKASCVPSGTTFNNDHWNTTNGTVYNTFSITPNPGYRLTLTSLVFTHQINGTASGWAVRSSLDNYTTDLGTGAVSSSGQTSTINLPAGTFTNIGTVIFRIYLYDANGGSTEWSNDDVTLNGSVTAIPTPKLGMYTFTGASACPNVNNNVTTQPTNATFSAFTNVGGTCATSASEFINHDLNANISIDLTEYNQFTITPAAGYTLSLTTFSFDQYVSKQNATSWTLRSSLDNYATDIAGGAVLEDEQTHIITLPSASFTNIGAVTFRLYVIDINGPAEKWSNDNVTVYGTVSGTPPPANPANPTSNSPQCANPGVTLTATGTPPAGVTWYWQTSATGTNI